MPEIDELQQAEDRSATPEQIQQIVANTNLNAVEKEKLLKDLLLQRELGEYFRDLYRQSQADPEFVMPSFQQVQEHIDELARTKYGVEYGVPLPPMNQPTRAMVMGRGAPLRHVGMVFRTEYEQELAQRQPLLHVRNSWERLDDRTCLIVDTAEGPMYLPRYHAGMRLRKIMDTIPLRIDTHQTAEAELRALESLKKRINDRQYQCYVLNGVFLELSKRSDIHYFFRKGLPTIACSFHKGYKKGFDEGRVLACLCLHPMGYYVNSHVGVMVPTDEVICALLMMRGDEHAFWKSSGQWSASDPRSGI